MRNIEEKIRNIIVGLLNCNITEAIYIFGSYGTKYYEDGISDIDIAWFTNKKIDLVIKTKFKNILEEVLNLKVDLVVVDQNSTEYLLFNIFETGECIFVGSSKFDEWFATFYDKTYLDREFLSIYLEERNKYV